MSQPLHYAEFAELRRREFYRLTKEERAALWRVVLGEPCCGHCAVGDTADCDVNPLAFVNVDITLALRHLRRAGEIP